MGLLHDRSLATRLVAATVIIVGLNLIGWLRPITNVIAGLLAPISSGLTGAGQLVARKIEGEHPDRLGLEAEIARLRGQSDAERLAQENEQLRAQLKFAATTRFNFVGAEVIGFQPDSARAALTINRGRAEGLKVGQAVVSNGYLAGKIETINEHTAEVILIGDPAFRIQAIDRATRSQGLVKGEVGGQVVLGNVAQNEPVGVGDTVLTSGSQGTFPKDLIIGRITKVESTAGTVFQTALIEPGVDLDRLQFVLVVTSGYTGGE